MFRSDPYGCSDELAAKRAQRDPFSHGGLTPERCPDMGELLDYCGPGQYPGPLPWSEERLLEEEEREALAAAGQAAGEAAAEAGGRQQRGGQRGRGGRGR